MKNILLLILASFCLIFCHKEPINGTKSRLVSLDGLKTYEQHPYIIALEKNGVFKLYDDIQENIILSGKICNFSPTKNGTQFNVATNSGLALVEVYNSYIRVVPNSSTEMYIFDNFEIAKMEFDEN